MAHQSAPVPTRVCEVVRNRCLQGRELGLTIYGLGRKIRFAGPHEAPAFEGDVAWFEVASKSKNALGVILLRQVKKPARPVHWSR